VTLDIHAWRPRFSHVTVARRRIRYVDTGSGEPLLLVHGLGASWRAWEQNIPDLSTDHRVIAVDLPGFGGSEPLRAPRERNCHRTLAAGAPRLRLLNRAARDDLPAAVAAMRCRPRPSRPLEALVAISPPATRSRMAFRGVSTVAGSAEL
jgi:pimeloyl-ACP methyl ester carboxylesterase